MPLKININNEIFVGLYKKHKSIMKVADELNVSYSTARSRLLGKVKFHPSGGVKNNTNYKKEKDKTAINLGFSDYDDAVLKLHFDHKKTTGEVGKLLNTTSRVIRDRIKNVHRMKTMGSHGRRGGRECNELK